MSRSKMNPECPWPLWTYTVHVSSLWGKHSSVCHWHVEFQMEMSSMYLDYIDLDQKWVRVLHLGALALFIFPWGRYCPFFQISITPHLAVSNRSLREGQAAAQLDCPNYQPVFQIDFYHVIKNGLLNENFFFKVKHAGAVEEEERTLATQALTQFCRCLQLSHLSYFSSTFLGFPK